MNVPGYHLHFLNATRTRGGHVLAAKIKSGRAVVDYTDRLHFQVPDTEDFAGADMDQDRTQELHGVER